MVPSLPKALLGPATVFRVRWDPLPSLTYAPGEISERGQDQGSCAQPPLKMSSPSFASTEAVQPGSHMHSQGPAAWVQTLVSPLACCVTMGKVRNFSVPHVPQM